MRRRLIIIATTIVALGAGGWLLIRALRPATPDITPLNGISNAQLIQVIKDKIAKDNEDFRSDDMSIIHRENIADQWVVAKMTINDLPVENDARTMVYIFQDDPGSLWLIDYSLDGFSTSRLPKSLPIHVIERANSI